MCHVKEARMDFSEYVAGVEETTFSAVIVKDPGTVQPAFELKQLDRHFAFVCRSHSKAFFFF